MSSQNEDKKIAEIDEGFNLMQVDPVSEALHRERKAKDKAWKGKDPETYKKDMEIMCKQMFGDNWHVEYEAMLKEEFPE
ncbi:hypothetical protein ACFL2Q_04965 [Thermodesulfobacteriota bacterium]